MYNPAMGNWKERIAQAIEEERRKAEIESAGAIAESGGEQRVRSHLIEKAKAEIALITNEAEEILKVLDRIRVREILKEVKRDVWGGLGEIKEELTSSIGVGARISDINMFNDRGSVLHGAMSVRREIGLFYSFASASLVVEGDVDVRDKKPKTLYFAVRDSINIPWSPPAPGLLGLPSSKSPKFSRIFQVGEDFRDEEVEDFVKDSILGFCVERTKANLLPTQLRDRIAEEDTRLMADTERHRQSPPWYKRLF